MPFSRGVNCSTGLPACNKCFSIAPSPQAYERIRKPESIAAIKNIGIIKSNPSEIRYRKKRRTRGDRYEEFRSPAPQPPFVPAWPRCRLRCSCRSRRSRSNGSRSRSPSPSSCAPASSAPSPSATAPPASEAPPPCQAASASQAAASSGRSRSPQAFLEGTPQAHSPKKAGSPLSREGARPSRTSCQSARSALFSRDTITTSPTE